MNTRRIISVVGSLCILSGIAVLSLFAYYSLRNKTVLAQGTNAVIIPIQAPVPVVKPNTLTGKPARIIVTAQNIDLTVEDGSYDPESKTWTLSSRSAHYALPSVQPNNDSGNTLIYGHYNKDVFSRLRKLNPGDTAIVITDNGLKFTYTFQSTTTVDPTNVDIFAYEGEPRLTLQTCSGAFMQNRQFYFFELTDVNQL